MKQYFKNLETERYKTCGHSKPYYDREGEYDEVMCDLMRDFCGEAECPLDRYDKEEER